MRAARTIVLGDIHGCWEELKDLLAAVEAGPQDRMISVGDLVCKGPDSGAVAEWAMNAPNLECVLGNHELRLLRHWRKGERSHEKPYDADAYAQLGGRLDDFMRFVARWPLTLSGPGFLVVHAGFDPREDLEWQSRGTLTTLRRLDDGRPWFDAYRGRTLAVFGHWAQKRPIVRSNAIGLDTGCVYGEALTALVLPERRLVSVPARRAYAGKSRWDEVPPSRSSRPSEVR
jgi:hypothetical protein